MCTKSVNSKVKDQLSQFWDCIFLPHFWICVKVYISFTEFYNGLRSNWSVLLTMVIPFLGEIFRGGNGSRWYSWSWYYRSAVFIAMDCLLGCKLRHQEIRSWSISSTNVTWRILWTNVAWRNRWMCKLLLFRNYILSSSF